MKDILSEIVAQKRIELVQQKQAVSPEQLQEQADRLVQSQPLPQRSLQQALAQSATGIIAEFKRRSPSKGWIHQNAQVSEVTPAYQAAGASALSILTDTPYFGGSLSDIHAARPLVHIPILRKEFIVDSYQLLQARVVGADAVLLIAACLTPEACAELTRQAHELHLEVLLEIHSEEELPYTACGADLIGVNNRHLGSFQTDVATSFRLADRLQASLPSGYHPVLVSESGLSHPDTLRQLRQAGYRGFLMGEAFMKHAQPAEALQQLIASVREEVQP